MDDVLTGLALPALPRSCRSLVERWDQVVATHGDRPALHSPGAAYTFGEADGAADQVAATLRGCAGVSAGSRVALVVDQDAAGLVGLLGILKAGLVIVPVDPHLPTERLRGIVERADVAVCLAGPAHVDRARDLAADRPVVDLGSIGPATSPEGAGSWRPDDEPARAGRDAAAIVFTSGSTGRPKGVVQSYDLLLNDVRTNAQRFGLTAGDRVALVLPYGFAAGLSLLFVTLLNGAGIWSFDPRDSGTRGLIAWIQDQRLTTLHCTPHLLRSLSGTLVRGSVLDSLRLVSTVGEAIDGRDVKAIREHLPPTATYVNWSGSSEIGTLATFEVGPGTPVPVGTVPAGRPVPGKDVHVRHEDGRLAPPGEAGELVVVSDHLANGYWQDEESTATRFGTWSDGRPSCLQGDLARVDEAGDLHLLGRSDAAVKVRGYLVEPAEIEAAFLAEEGVKEVVVVALVDPQRPTRLAAYVVPAAESRTQSPAALRRRLRDRLPEYMVPATVVNVPELPRNERGKVDRVQLPPVERQTGGAPPSTQWEIVMADLWSEVLGLEEIGLDDDFMALGGDSLSVEEMLQSVQETLGVALVSTDVVEAPTLRAFTRRATLGSAILPTHPDVVALRTGSDHPPVFCFAGSGALGLSFLPLSRHLEDRSVYAFQAHGLERRGIPDWTVASAAERFLEIIRLIQPHGPYVLLGHSFGGLLALEAAQRLTAAGERVELLGLLDTYLPHRAGQQPTFQYETLAERPRTSGGALGRGLRDGLQRLVPDGLPAVDAWARHARKYVAGVVPFSGQRQFDAFFDHGNLAMRRYALQPYAGRVLVVFAESNPDGQEGWAAALTGAARFVDLPAEHSSLLREPWATELAGVLRTELGPVA